jgi:hypothetical protein
MIANSSSDPRQKFLISFEDRTCTMMTLSMTEHLA